MRMLGWCEICRRTRMIRVNLSKWIGGAPTGVCDECENKGKMG